MEQLAVVKKRIDSIDMLRGLVMIIMALDHVRDFFYIDAMTGNPTDPSTTTPLLFFTRWITHFCAPVFVFLAGTSAFLAGRKKSKKELGIFLVKRGLWLMVADLLVFNLLLTFDPQFHLISVSVLCVTGLSMILLAGLIYLPMPVIFTIGLVMVAGHNLLDGFNAKNPQNVSVVWGLLHQQFIRVYAPGRLFGGFYPLIPWPGIMMLGYCMGTFFTSDYPEVKRRRNLILIGLIVTLSFFVIRWLNAYGDLLPWKEEKDSVSTTFSFFNVTKYPPSLLFCCMTLGPALIGLAFLEKVKAGWSSVVVIYGRVPFFYYFLHFFLVHLLCTILFFATGHTMAEAAGSTMYFRPVQFGFSLRIVYLIWIGIVVILYPFCKKYSQYKATHTHWWLSYL
ncbi:MAG: DUF1624 domain-containing protein [Bacteroidota bacterium]|nr:DUF1624 domain-containing protein [Bacteroidota bacterium]